MFACHLRPERWQKVLATLDLERDLLAVPTGCLCYWWEELDANANGVLTG